MIAVAACALLTVSSVSAKSKQTKIYAFGFAASFNDSTVYLTDIQPIDSAWLEEKTNFLVSRDNYSYQLRDYLANQGQEHRTCLVSYALKRKKTEKKYLALRKKYAAKGNFDIKYISLADFQFKAVAPMEISDQEAEKIKAEKKKRKKEQSQRPAMRPGQGQGGPGGGQGGPGGNGGMPPM
jgi:hypothetical protein